MDHNGTLGAVLGYLRDGRSIFPLKPGTKKPLLDEIKPFQERHLTEEEAVRFWTANPDAGIGMYLGRVSGGLVALDVDDDDGGFFRYIVADPEKLDTPLIRTHGERRQVWFLFPPDKCPNRDVILQGVVEVRGNAHYSVVPPSIHPTGQPCEFLNGVREPKRIEDVDSFMAMLKERAEEWPYAKAALPRWTRGRRQDLAMGLAGFFRKRLGWGEGRARAAIQNVTRMAGDEEAFQRMTAVQSTFRKRMGDVAVGQYLGAELAHELTALAPASSSREPRSRFYMDGRLKPGRVAEWLLEKYTFKTLDDTEEVLRYEDEKGVYAPAESTVKAEVQAALGMDRCSTNAVNEVLGHIRRSTFTARASFDADPAVVNVQNGLLSLTEGALAPHTAEHLSTVQLPVAFDPEATCLNFDRFLGEILLEEDRAAVQEMFGYCLYRSSPVHQAPFLEGGGRNGKSTLCKVLTAFLGRESVSSVPLQSLDGDRFMAAQLYGKLANVFADIPPTPLRRTQYFKTITAGDPIEAQRKFQSPFTFEPYTKLIFSMNRVPPTHDDSDAFYARARVIHFPHQFTDDARNQDDLLGEIASPEELSGILNWALEGLGRLLRQGEYTGTRTIAEARTEYIRLSDPVQAFVMDTILPGKPEDYVTKDTLYRHYAEYCRERGYLVLPSNRFSIGLKQHAPYAWGSRRPRKAGKKRVTVWKGLIYGPDAEKKPKQRRVDRPKQASNHAGRE